MTDSPKKKRKRQESESVQKALTHSNILTAFQKQKKKKNKATPERDDDFVIRWQSPALQADLVVEKLRILNPNMSAIELGELSIPGFSSHEYIYDLEKGFFDTASWDSSQRNAIDLPDFLQHGTDLPGGDTNLQLSLPLISRLQPMCLAHHTLWSCPRLHYVSRT
jgi:hypothetical protein